MLEQIPPLAMLFFTLYGGAAATALLLCLYLLLSRVNVISPGQMPPQPLRRWAAAFFGMAAAGHAYWLLAYAYGFEEHSRLHALLAVLDGTGMLITLFGTLLSMLQDRRRPLRPFVAATVPIVVLGVLETARPDIDFVTPIIVYALSLYTVFTAYMTNAVRQYRQWLRGHYADLEHKELWASLTLLIAVLLLLVFYGLASDGPSLLLIRLTDFALFAFLLWRVETLPLLAEATEHEQEQTHPQSLPVREGGDNHPEENTTAELSTPPPHREGQGSGSATANTLSRIGQLLAKHCEQTQLYLQQDLTLSQLSAAVGVNRYYLGQYFASQDTSYYAYIHNLRISHAVARYRQALSTGQPLTAQQLAQESGYHSYSTFSTAFKQRMGQSVTAWMCEQEQLI